MGCKIDILSSFITPNEKAKIIENFNKPSKTMQIIFNCNSLKEGIDTKICDALLFMDNKTSFNLIVQNIGRCVRLKSDDEPSLIFIPLTEFDEKEYLCVKELR